MDTSKMRHFEDLDAKKIFALLSKADQGRQIAQDFHEAMETSLVREQIRDVVKDYAIGELLEVYEIFGGYVNRSFGIYTLKDGEQREYFVRKYKKGITEKEILFEHSLIEFAIANGLSIAAGLIPNKQGATFVKRQEGGNGSVEDVYFAIYRFLPGEDKYTWDNPIMTDEEYASAAEVLAMIHNSTRHFNPNGLERVEPKIMEFLPTLPPVYRAFAERNLNTKFHQYYRRSLDAILAVIESARIPEEETAKMPYNPCHNDFHPGNLKFSNNKAVGVFDFDWSKIELRLFDVCLALAYCCSSWEDEQDGTLLLDKCQIFLAAYQRKLRELGGLEPLNQFELKHLPTMMAAANLYLINWDVTAYYNGTNLNDYEYLAYLQHNVRLMKWIEAHKDDIEELAHTL